MKFLPLPLSLCSVLLLNGCLDVDDNSNDELVQALQQQNQILIDEQNQASQVTLQGLIVHAYDQQPVSNAIVNVKLGATTLIENLSVADGQLQLPQLPANSDIEIVISSENGEFVQRVFFYNTGEATPIGGASDIGLLSVSEGIVVTLDIQDTTNDVAYSELEFTGFSHFGSGSSMHQYAHTSSFSDGVYSIELPKYLNVSIFANLDIDRDGEPNFTTVPSNYLSGNDLFINFANQSDFYNIFLISPTSPRDIEYRVSIVDGMANSLSGAELNLLDASNTFVSSIYDESTEQYVLSAEFNEREVIDIPSFTANGVTYQSSSISLALNNNGELDVFNSNSNNCCFTVEDSDVVELVIAPRVNVNTSNLEVVYRSEQVSSSDQSFSVFYSQPVGIVGTGISLINGDGFTTTKGNDSTEDLVLPGTTLLVGRVNVATTSTMSLNNTKLTITPEQSLIAGNRYEYSVGALELLSDNSIVDVSGDDLFFTVENITTDIFDINDVKLDNESYTTNGVAITTENTAGETSSPFNFDRSTYLYFPNSINSLQTLTLRKATVTEEGSERVDTGTYEIVTNGNPRFGSSATLQLADNEFIVRENISVNVIHSTAQPDTQRVYRVYTGESISDDISGSENSITFEYSYETKAGEVFTGNISLPVQ